MDSCDLRDLIVKEWRGCQGGVLEGGAVVIVIALGRIIFSISKDGSRSFPALSFGGF
jgi:hypothetical protein